MKIHHPEWFRKPYIRTAWKDTRWIAGYGFLAMVALSAVFPTIEMIIIISMLISSGIAVHCIKIWTAVPSKDDALAVYDFYHLLADYNFSKEPWLKPEPDFLLVLFQLPVEGRTRLYAEMRRLQAYPQEFKKNRDSWQGTVRQFLITLKELKGRIYDRTRPEGQRYISSVSDKS